MRLNLKRFTALLIVTLSLTACQRVNEQEETQPEATTEEQIKARALQDEFTRSMLKSAQETEKGYYTLESKTGVYEMLFPTGGEIDGIGYTRKGESSEAFLAGILYNDKTEAQLSVRYTTVLSNDETGIGYAKELLTNSIGEDMKFEQIDGKGKVTYVAPFKKKETGSYGYGAYIHPDEGWGGVEIIYTGSCMDDPKSCGPEEEEFKKRAYKLISSVKFLNKNEAKK
ncbi:hypothetical protein AS180_20390 [Priestia veravalensis]|uniref:Lipoprotein n=1 Tax=Priestia veravalensis TaxID=1414648 RepID=A0A0V8JGI5_9BACI|nr:MULTISPECIES: hypothetical protein [Priestia]KSU86117.1 hypothetical protein AS180_20390 [Priestia veravalensis]SCC57535.1 hypothetical protein GA0061087_11021 [Priestia flexa]